MIIIENQITSLTREKNGGGGFLKEFEKPFKCEKCNERFKKKKCLREQQDRSPFTLREGAGGGI